MDSQCRMMEGKRTDPMTGINEVKFKYNKVKRNIYNKLPHVIYDCLIFAFVK